MSKKSKRKRKSDPSKAQQEIGDKNMQNTDSIVKVHGAVEVHPSQDSKTLHNTEREEDTRQKGKEYSLSRRTFRVAVAALTISTVYSVLTLLIFFQSKKAAEAAKSAAETADKSLKDSQRAFEVQNRPYVIIDGTAYFLHDQNQKVKINLANISYKNIGKSPAQDVFGLARFTKWRYPGEHTQEALLSHVEEAFKPIVEDETKISLAYNKLDKVDIAPEAPDLWVTRDLKDTEALSSTDARDLLDVKGNVMLFYVGKIHYAGFEKTKSYTTEFCFFFFGPDTKTWHYCPTHNTIQ